MTQVISRDRLCSHPSKAQEVIEAKEESWAYTAQHVASISFPLMSLYQSVSPPLLITFAAARIFTAVTDFKASLQMQGLSGSFFVMLQTGVAVGALVGIIFVHPLAILITTGLDLSIEVTHFVKGLAAGEYKNAMEKCLAVVNQALYLALFLSGGVGWALACLAIQTLMALYYAADEFEKNENAHLLIALITAEQFCVRMFSQVLSKLFFFGYRILDPQEAEKRMSALKSKVPVSQLHCTDSSGTPLDVIYLATTVPHKTDHILVFAETTSYQDRVHSDGSLPSQFQHFLDEGINVVLWNPSHSKNIESKQYADDLLSVLKSLKEIKTKHIAIKGYCATVEPVISAAVDSGLENLSLILDRGFSNTRALARSFTPLSEIPWIAQMIQKRFSCNGENKLKRFSGNVIFVAPEDPAADQITSWKGRNLTYEMYHLRNGKDPLVLMDKDTTDHWSPWHAGEYAAITSHLKKFGVIPEKASDAPQGIPQKRPPLTLFQRTLYPWFVKTYC